jgi:hypothetical protein
LIRFPAPTSLLHVRSRAAETSARARPRSSRGALGYLKLVDRRISQVPGESIPYLCPALGPRPVRTDLAMTVGQCSPHLWDGEDTSSAVISRLNDAASVFAAYASRACCHALCKAHFRPVADLCRVGVEPTGFHRRVSAPYIAFSLPRLDLARPQFTPRSGLAVAGSPWTPPASSQHPTHSKPWGGLADEARSPHGVVSRPDLQAQGSRSRPSCLVRAGYAEKARPSICRSISVGHY